jgi:hypothetical protein
MARRVSFAFGLAAAVCLLRVGTGCSTPDSLTGNPDAGEDANGAASDAGGDGATRADTAGNDASVVACTGVQDCSGLFFAASSVYCCTGEVCVPDTPDDCTDANAQLIQASSYDQSCKTDSDCVAVFEGNACYPAALNCQDRAAINMGSYAQYQADIAKTRAASCYAPGDCTVQFGPCCRSGSCQMGAQCPSGLVPTRDAAVEADADAGSEQVRY